MGRKKLHLNTALFAQKPRLHERAVAVLLDSIKKNRQPNQAIVCIYLNEGFTLAEELKYISLL